MKNRLNITIDESLIEQAKRYAERHSISLSQLVEDYFKSLTRPARKKNILDVVRDLPTPKTNIMDTGREAYYNQQKKKYGF